MISLAIILIILSLFMGGFVAGVAMQNLDYDRWGAIIAWILFSCLCFLLIGGSVQLFLLFLP